MKIPVILCCVLGALPSLLPAADASVKTKATFRVLYNNDTTNILSSESPFNRDGKTFNTQKIDASVDETADCGVDVLMMAGGMGWDPWWQSQALPMKTHTDWQWTRKRQKPNAYQQYVLEGGDVVDAFVAEAHKKGQKAFATFRMNDGHHYFGSARIEDPAERAKKMAVTQFFDENPQLRLGPEADPDARSQYALDFARPEVRAYRMQFLKELAQKKDLDGIELDFMRFWIMFHPFRTTSQERADIVTAFVKEVRAELDKNTAPGQRRYLSVRIPAYRDVMDKMGVSPKRLATEAGVDIFNISSHYYTNMQTEAPLIRKELPDNVAVYAEVAHFTNAKQNYKVPLVQEKGDAKVCDAGNVPANAKFSWVFRRTTDQALMTAAHMAYARGLDGVSAFNFQYYRSTRNPTDVFGQNIEPPFKIFEKLRDPKWLAKQPQYYFLAHQHNEPYRDGRPFQNVFFPDAPQTQWLDMAPPVQGWGKEGRLRIQSMNTLKGTRWDVCVNGTALAPTPDVSEPYPNPYTTAVGTAENYQAWTLPSALLKDGLNEITVVLRDGPPTALFYLDIALPTKE